MSMLTRRSDRGMVPVSPANEWMKSWLDSFPEFRHPWNELLPASRLDVRVDEHDVKVRLPFAGCAKKDFEIEATGDFLTVKVARRAEPEDTETARYTCRERSYEAYEESVKLPVEIRGGEAKATYRDGVLEILIPRVEEKKPLTRSIEVR